ncbi:hypothetical protein [Microbulbifer hydrolyticus]|uniref:Uncharacterized protein n=1 Tax=Microbulbifer hydrolyticus TaxID=48074 RepID=A0AA89T456_9GAMM|nr:hypothetical protein [Microbulbifer hydrolyticus]MBB5210277.1 hypothetical protein [Microbulbifer hydrolyticus]
MESSQGLSQKSGLPRNLKLVFRRIGEQLDVYHNGSCHHMFTRTEGDIQGLLLVRGRYKRCRNILSPKTELPDREAAGQ